MLATLVVAISLPPSRPARPEIAAVVKIGGQPQDAVLADGSLWVSDYSGHVINVDPASGRVTARIDVDGYPEGIAAGAGAVWVASPDAYKDGRGSLVPYCESDGAQAPTDRQFASGSRHAYAPGCNGSGRVALLLVFNPGL